MIALHLLCSWLSYAAFLIASVAGALFLAQERQLKQKRMGLLFHRLPSLETLDRLNFWAVGAGFTLLSCGLACGFWGSWILRGRWWSWDPKELLTVALWGVYLAVWMIRWRSTLRGRKVAVLSMLGFGVVLLAFLSVNRWLPTWHAYV